VPEPQNKRRRTGHLGPVHAKDLSGGTSETIPNALHPMGRLIGTDFGHDAIER